MALCPFAVIKLLHPEAEQAPRITPTQHIRHTAVTTAASLYGYFARVDVAVESHFFIAADGTLEQYVDTEQRADAQFDGNLHGVSTETWDNGDPDHTPWTPAQIDTDRRLSQWLHDVHGIPLAVCAGPQSPGQGYHSLFPEWARDGHTCPNALRIDQFNTTIIPNLAGDDMTPEQSAKLDRVDAYVAWLAGADPGKGYAPSGGGIPNIEVLVKQLAARPAAAGGPAVLSDVDVDRIASKVADKLAARLAS